MVAKGDDVTRSINGQGATAERPEREGSGEVLGGLSPVPAKRKSPEPAERTSPEPAKRTSPEPAKGKQRDDGQQALFPPIGATARNKRGQSVIFLGWGRRAGKRKGHEGGKEGSGQEEVSGRRWQKAAADTTSESADSCPTALILRREGIAGYAATPEQSEGQVAGALDPTEEQDGGSQVARSA
ncbi:hypothetical protein Ssi02_68070 [Sinosporangium siamense]|uniref:Uncharacterized protein n=1 Tax=Sinosporangium siamense TaxID=1367973 RepID=A0A919RMM2_9ACTN|nr:hypothetical protein Ssi02_68070 [Sinosporangium siamense]